MSAARDCYVRQVRRCSVSDDSAIALLLRLLRPQLQAERTKEPPFALLLCQAVSTVPCVPLPPNAVRPGPVGQSQRAHDVARYPGDTGGQQRVRGQDGKPTHQDYFHALVPH